MIDTEKLRRLLNSADMVDGIDLHANIKSIVRELLDRLEAAERAVSEAYARGYETGKEEVEAERDALRAKVEQMERQEPVAYQRLYKDGSGSEDITDFPDVFERQRPLYARPVPAQSVPEGWLRAIDEALIVTHLGVANANDTYETAKAKLDALIGWHCDVATDPAVNGGWQLVPVDIHPLDRSNCEKIIGLLANPPSAKDFNDENDYYAEWWNQLLSAAPKPEVK